MMQLQIMYLVALVLQAQPSLGKPWFFATGPAESQEPNQAQQPAPMQQQQSQSQPQPQPQQPPASPDDDFLLVGDDELVHNKKVLKNLRNADPKEVEELIDNNPVLEEIVLKKIQARLERESQYPILKVKPKKVYGYPGVVHHQESPNHHHHHHQEGKKQQEQEYLEDWDAEQDDHEAEEHVVDADKYKSLKDKLKTKAAKIFKMGSGFKEKYAALRKRYKVKPKKTKEVELVEHPVSKLKLVEVEELPVSKLKLVEKEIEKPKKYYYEVSH